VDDLPKKIKNVLKEEAQAQRKSYKLISCHPIALANN
jgi:hypothetical protein